MRVKSRFKIIPYLSSIFVTFISISLLYSADNPCEDANAFVNEIKNSFSNYLNNLPISKREKVLQEGYFEVKSNNHGSGFSTDYEIYYMLDSLPIFYKKMNLDYSSEISAIKLSKRSGLFIRPYYLGAGGAIDCSYIIFPKDDRFESMQLGHAAGIESLDKDEEDEIISLELLKEFDFEKCQPSNAIRPWWINIFHIDAERGRLVDVSNKFPKYYESMLPRYKKDNDTFWSNTKCKEEFKQLIKKIESMANIAEDNNSALIESLKELMNTSIEKIESDINLTATAFADARNIQRSLKWADIFGAALNIVTGTINTISSMISLKDPSNAISDAFLDYKLPLQIFSGFLTIDSLRQSGEKLQLAFDGPTYDSNVKKMLEEAYKESSTKLFFNFQAFQTTIKNHVLGLYGTSPVFIPHKSSDLTRNNIEIVYGTDKVQTAIRNRLRSVIDKLGKNRIPSEKEQEIISQIDTIRKAILRSKLNNTRTKYKTYLKNENEFSEVEQELWLGNINELNKARLDALTNFDKRIEREEILTISKTVGSMLTATAIFLSINYPGKKVGEDLAKIAKAFILPAGIDLSDRIMKTSIYKTNPRDQINMIPQEMLLALSKEISDVWMIAEDVANYVEYQLKPTKYSIENIFYIKDDCLWFMKIDEKENKKLINSNRIWGFKPSSDNQKVIFSANFADNNWDTNGDVYITDNSGKSILKISKYSYEYWDYDFSCLSNEEKIFLREKDTLVLYLVNGLDSFKKIFSSSIPTANLSPDEHLSYADLSPDEENIIYVTWEGGGYGIHHIYLMNLKTLVSHEISKSFETVGSVKPLWSPCGRKIIFSTMEIDQGIEHGLYIQNIDTKKLLKLGEWGEDAMWSPDGEKIVFVQFSELGRGIYVIDSDGSNKRLIVADDESIVDRLPQWDLYGKRIIFNRYYKEYRSEVGLHSPEIWIVDVDGKKQRRLTEKGCYLGYANWGD